MYLCSWFLRILVFMKAWRSTPVHGSGNLRQRKHIVVDQKVEAVQPERGIWDNHESLPLVISFL